MDFILVSDALFASEARYALAQHNTVGTRVGSFQVLLETLAELWVLLPPDEQAINDPWQDLVQEQALAMADAFWGNSIKADERGTLQAITASLQFVLNHCPLGSTLQPICNKNGGILTRQQRYYNDLVRLQQAIGQRPTQQQMAEQWLAESDNAALESLYLYPLYQPGAFTEQDLQPWQRSVIEKLREKGWLQLDSGRYTQQLAALNNIDIQQVTAINELVQTLFSQPTQPLSNPADSIQWFTCRDAAEEAEATAVMVQQAINSGTATDQIAVVVPRGTDHSQWLGHYLQRAGITASNLRPAANQIDWQTALLQNLLAHRACPDVRMAMQCVFINPLMPWSAVTGYRLAKKYAGYEVLEQEPESRQAFINLLLQQPDETAADLMQWLQSISGQLNHRGVIGLGKKRLQQLLEQTRRLLDVYKDLSFADQLQNLLRHLSVGSIALNGERPRYLNSVLVLEEGEPLPITVQRLYVLGFNNGHYQYLPAYTGALNRQQWDDLTLAHLPTQGAEQLRWQQGFRHLLSSVSINLVFMRSMADADGNRLEASETLIDMALCYCPADKLTPESLEQPLAEAADIWHAIKPSRSAELQLSDTLHLGHSLLGMFQHRDGSERSESPSSLEKMMLSPLAWLFNRLHIEPEQWEAAGQSPKLAGIIAHQVFEDYRQHQHEAWNETKAAQWFEKAISQHAPFLHGPQFALPKQQLRNDVLKALQALQQWLQHEGWEITATEQELSGTIQKLSNISVKGKADAVLNNEKGDVLILDYKNSKYKNRLKQLTEGYELQTRLYRELYQHQQQAGGMIHSAYYTLKDQTLVAGVAINRCELVNTINPGDMGLAEQSEKAEERLQSVLQQLQNGIIVLNKATDKRAWEKRGLSTYTLKDNRLVQRFTLVDINNNEADA
ncbi:hypothetical protein CBP31_06365 [Oceanisphaera profunda]|uniref:Uncharacterized protein n=1 Tax=Oceanisphaera profunda TaxID=1416627 RepID=A0A1Y0D4S2_9GAMM|nr:PD-(D/E)XK nuclease family protein [Oceanisphaera profunda]ART82294.1 hypothetical protein CBP31_06365 [Oceanisphaera profunda]